MERGREGRGSVWRGAFLVPQINLGATIFELFLFPKSKAVGIGTYKSGRYKKVLRLFPFFMPPKI